MHISQKSFLPSFLYDLPVGHDKPLHASLYQTESFQDNANYDKFHHPALCAFLLISLIRENRGGSRCFSWGACCLIEWCWNCNPQPPFFLPSQLWPPRLFCLFIFFLPFEAISLGLAGNGSTNLTWAQKNYVNTKCCGATIKVQLSVLVKLSKPVCVCVCNMKDRTTVWNVYSAWDSVNFKNKSACNPVTWSCWSREKSPSRPHPKHPVKRTHTNPLFPAMLLLCCL